MNPDWIVPQWPAPPGVRALMTTRAGGSSGGPYAGFNVGDHVGDHPGIVAAHRQQLEILTGVPALWLRQVHGTRVAVVEAAQSGDEADAAVCRSPGMACAVMTADCLPVLLCSDDGRVVAAAHAGWRGLNDGVLEATLSAMNVAPARVMVWLGAAIGPGAFEVGEEVRDAFLSRDPAIRSAFQPGAMPGKWLADLYAIASARLRAKGVPAIYGGDLCTYRDADRFYSYRRDGVTGRMVSMIWLASSLEG